MIALALLAAVTAETGDPARMARLLAAEVRLARRPSLALLLAPRSWDETAHQQILLDAARTGLHRRAAALARQMAASEKAARVDDLAVAEVAGGPFVTIENPAAPYRLPVAGRMLVGFGTIDQRGIRSRGIMLLPADRAPLVTPGAGRVAYAGPYRGYGDVLILEHGHGWTSLVAGGKLVDFAVGGWIACGQAIGTANGPLLLELRHDGRPVDVLAAARKLGGSAISQQALPR